MKLVELDVPRQAKRAQRNDTVPVDVDFVPGKSMTGGLRNRGVIKSNCQKVRIANPETVGKDESEKRWELQCACRRPANGVQSVNRTKENPPHQVR